MANYKNIHFQSKQNVPTLGTNLFEYSIIFLEIAMKIIHLWL